MNDNRLKNDGYGAWLTINRACNLRCVWCYAQETQYLHTMDMPLDLAKRLIDMLCYIGVKSVALIGGEPTIHPNLFEILDYLKEKGLSASFITNGIAFSNLNFVEKINNYDIQGVDLSVKAGNAVDYVKYTGVDCFSAVEKAICNLNKYKIPFMTSLVLTNDNVNDLISIVKTYKELGAEDFYFEFCSAFFDNDTVTDYRVNPVDLVTKFSSILPELEEITTKYIINQNLPSCIWDKTILDYLATNNHLQSICQVQNKSGIIFDTVGNLLMCNVLSSYPIGYLDTDYYDGKTLSEYLSSEKLFSYYRYALRSPSKSCHDCNEFANCGGGCILQWFNYDFDELMSLKNKQGG